MRFDYVDKHYLDIRMLQSLQYIRNMINSPNVDCLRCTSVYKENLRTCMIMYYYMLPGFDC